MDVAREKEETIIGLSEILQSQLTDLQCRLDLAFSRDTEAQSKGTERTQSPNVLDEIIENLEDNTARLSSIISFLSANVFPKIS